MSRGWAKASACRLQITPSCAFLCHIVSLQYLSRSSLHRLAGLPCRLFLSYGLQVVTREVHRWIVHFYKNRWNILLSGLLRLIKIWCWIQICHLVRIVRIQYGFWPFLRWYGRITLWYGFETNYWKTICELRIAKQNSFIFDTTSLFR